MTTSPFSLSLEGHPQRSPQNPSGPGSFPLISNPELRFLESDGLCRNPRIGPLTPAFATDPRNRQLSPIIATDPKTPSRNSFVCHTCDTPRVSSLPKCPRLLTTHTTHCPLPTCLSVLLHPPPHSARIAMYAYGGPSQVLGNNSAPSGV